MVRCTCQECGREFVYVRPRKYCSEVCLSKMRSRPRRLRALAQQRPKKEKAMMKTQLRRLRAMLKKKKKRKKD